MIDVSVIVATWKRPQLLHHTLAQYRSQVHGLKTECIVVSDGPDARAGSIAEYYGCRYQFLDENSNDWGATPNDVGVLVARGKSVVFWNDDNMYYPRALKCLHESRQGYDIGVCQTVHWTSSGYSGVIPKEWSGQFKYADIDSMCVCVDRDLAARYPWARPDKPYECDLRWLERLYEEGAIINFNAVVIGEHL